MPQGSPRVAAIGSSTAVARRLGAESGGESGRRGRGWARAGPIPRSPKDSECRRGSRGTGGHPPAACRRGPVRDHRPGQRDAPAVCREDFLSHFDIVCAHQCVAVLIHLLTASEKHGDRRCNPADGRDSFSAGGTTRSGMMTVTMGGLPMGSPRDGPARPRNIPQGKPKPPT